MNIITKFRELLEQTRKNKRDKKFWTLLHDSLNKIATDKDNLNRRNYRKRYAKYDARDAKKAKDAKKHK